ncbi:hypothetical protein KDK_12900 [Dictyobacter kobayashii]|uniref:Uncharacterized protein n=1 Tax=Dictyobacter kobayashii TaxID=2014872 RepID=A0A402AEF3_9CHLR|nr:hypothetical protein KDK_12900 [Dictyobacter kobayashii]
MIAVSKSILLSDKECWSSIKAIVVYMQNVNSSKYMFVLYIALQLYYKIYRF